MTAVENNERSQYYLSSNPPDMTTMKSQHNARFAEAVSARMNELGLTIKDLADHTDTTYENVRKVVRGIGAPSRYMVSVLCEVLKMDRAQMEELAVADRIEQKYGGVPYAMFGQDPELALLQSSWEKLTAEQKHLLRVQIRSWAEMNEGRSGRGRRPIP